MQGVGATSTVGCVGFGSRLCLDSLGTHLATNMLADKVEAGPRTVLLECATSRLIRCYQHGTVKSLSRPSSMTPTDDARSVQSPRIIISVGEPMCKG